MISTRSWIVPIVNPQNVLNKTRPKNRRLLIVPRVLIARLRYLVSKYTFEPYIKSFEFFFHVSFFSLCSSHMFVDFSRDLLLTAIFPTYKCSIRIPLLCNIHFESSNYIFSASFKMWFEYLWQIFSPRKCSKCLQINLLTEK